MKIALINENSQAAKNSMICENLKKIVEPMGHEVFNYGMYTAEDETQLTYVMCGLLSAILLNSKAADYVVTGCGTGEGAMLACNSFPGVLCGHIVDVVLIVVIISELLFKVLIFIEESSRPSYDNTILASSVLVLFIILITGKRVEPALVSI